MYLHVRSTEFACTKPGELAIMYLYVRSTSQESEWSCICMLGVQARRVGGHVLAC
jgi:hypothetical protein